LMSDVCKMPNVAEVQPGDGLASRSKRCCRVVIVGKSGGRILIARQCGPGGVRARLKLPMRPAAQRREDLRKGQARGQRSVAAHNGGIISLNHAWR